MKKLGNKFQQTELMIWSERILGKKQNKVIKLSKSNRNQNNREGKRDREGGRKIVKGKGVTLSDEDEQGEEVVIWNTLQQEYIFAQREKKIEKDLWS